MKNIRRFIIAREEIESLNLNRFLAQFGDWPNRKGKKLRDLYGGLELMIGGYDLIDDDELYLIPQVREYIRGLHKAWPWLFFFLNPADEMFMIWVLCLLEEVGCSRREGAMICEAAFNPSEILDLIAVEFTHMNTLFDQAGMSDEENIRRTEAIVGRFFPGLMKHLKDGD